MVAAYKAPGYTYIMGLAWSSVQSGREGELFSLCARDQANSIMWLYGAYLSAEGEHTSQSVGMQQRPSPSGAPGSVGSGH